MHILPAGLSSLSQLPPSPVSAIVSKSINDSQSDFHERKTKVVEEPSQNPFCLFPPNHCKGLVRPKSLWKGSGARTFYLIAAWITDKILVRFTASLVIYFVKLQIPVHLQKLIF